MDKFAYNPPEGFFFDEEEHSYFMDGKLIPGVTTVCGLLSKPWLSAWKVKVCADYIRENITPMTMMTKDMINGVVDAGKKEANKRRDSAADKGKEVHAWIETHIKGKYTETPSDIEVGRVVVEFLKWESAVKPKWLTSEMMVASRQHEYAGTLDFIADINGKCVLGDFKTSKQWSDEWGLQTGAYQLAVEEMGGKIDERWVVRLPMIGGEVEAHAVSTPYDLDSKTFLALRQAQKWVSFTEARKEKKAR